MSVDWLHGPGRLDFDRLDRAVAARREHLVGLILAVDEFAPRHPDLGERSRTARGNPAPGERKEVFVASADCVVPLMTVDSKDVTRGALEAPRVPLAEGMR